MAAFFGCRPRLLFGTRVKFDSSVNDGLGKPTKSATATQRADVGKQNSNDVYMDDIYDTKSCGDDNVMAVQSNYRVGNESSSARESDRGDSDSVFSTADSSNSDSDSDSDSYSCSVYNSREDGDTGDYDAGLEKTRSFLYRHFTISIVPNLTTRKPNMVFMKAALLHTKGVNHNPRM